MKNYLLVFLKGILAGAAIGVGGFLYLLMTHLIDGELGKVLGALLFSIGLFTVCSCSLALYTGKIGLVFEKRQETSFYISLPVMLVGNAVGAIGLGYFCHLIFKNSDLMVTVNAVAASRTTFNGFNDFLSLIVKSLLCGLCVYLAVKCFSLNRMKPLGIGLLVLFVFIFVYAGFQHCIANMYYLAFANSYGNGYAYLNIFLCILFNSLGTIPGILLFRNKEAK